MERFELSISRAWRAIVAVLLSMRLQVSLFLITALFALVGCGSNPLRDRINQAFPPLSTLDQQRLAIALGNRELVEMTPTVHAQLGAATVAAHLKRAIDQHVPQLREVAVTVGRQEITVSAAFLLQVPKPSIRLKGHVIGSVATSVDGSELVLLPAFRAVELSQAEYDGALDLGALVPLANKAIESFLENINGQVAALVERRIPLMLPAIEVSGIANALAKVPGFSDVSATSRNIVLRVGRAALLIAPDSIEVLGQLEPQSQRPSQRQAKATLRSHSNESEVRTSYDVFVQAFNRASEPLRSPNTSAGLGVVVVRKEALSRLLNEALADLEVCATYSGKSGRQDFRTTLTPFEMPANFGCDATRDCSPSGDCSLQEDTRNCKRTGPFGIEFNDPICEVAKGAQNAGYAVAKATCEARKSGAKLDCERLKATEKGLCELNKEWLKRVAATGPVGDIAGHLDVSGQARACVKGIHVGEHLEELAATLGLENASASLHGDLEFTPKNLGHLACVARWQEPFATNVILPAQSHELKGQVTAQSSSEGLRLTLTTQPVAVDGQITPAPFQAIFNAHPHLYVVCLPTAIAVFGHSGVKALRHEDLDPLVSGKVRRDIPELPFNLMIKPVDVVLDEKAFRAIPEWGQKSIVLTLNESRTAVARR